VAEAQAGSRAAFEELVRRYDRDVLRLALNLMKRPETPATSTGSFPEGLSQSLSLPLFECSFYTWLYRIVTTFA